MLTPRTIAVFLVASGITLATAARGDGGEAMQRPRDAVLDLAAPMAVGEPSSGWMDDGPVEAAIETRAWTSRIEARFGELRARHGEAHPAQARGARLDPELASMLRPVLASAPRGGRLALHVRDLETGEVLFDERGEQRLNPASNQKILTAHAAVELLGADYRFETHVRLAGDTLYLVGEGDPSLQVADLHALAAETLRELGDRRPLQIVVDDRAFGARDFAPGVAEHEGEAAYLAPTGALSVNFNTVELTVLPGPHAGAPLELEVYPPDARVEIVNHARTGSGHPGLRSHADEEGRTVLEVFGGLRPGAKPISFRRRIHDPAAFTGHAFAGALRAAGEGSIGQLPVSAGQVPSDALELTTHRSAPLVEVLDASMKYSSNFATEQVLRTLSWRATGEPGDWQHGLALLERFRAAIGSDPDAAHFINGSGLGHEGRTTPAAIVDLLSLAADEGSASAQLLGSYTGHGREGTLHHRRIGADGRVRAKTGTLAGVSALSGVVASKDGERLLGFSILVNGARAQDSKPAQDRVVRTLLHWLDRQ